MTVVTLTRQEAHPLLLLAMWRQAPSRSSPVLVALQRFPGLEALLTETEKAGGGWLLESWKQSCCPGAA